MPKATPPAAEAAAAVDDEGAAYKTVYELMGEILAELPAIGKNQQNTEQNFMFRGYDDVLNALNPIMSERGVFVVPDVVERVRELRQTRSGGTMYEVNLHVRFTAYGPGGDSVSGSAWGEGTDMGDKATNKAMTNAFKYWLFQTFAISTREASETDADRYTPEETHADVLYCRVCSASIEGARSDRQKMRDHLGEEHGWVAVTIDGESRMVTPEKAAEYEAAQQDKDATAPDTGDDADSSTVGTTPVDDAPADDAWVEELRGSDLVATAKSYGVSASGKVSEIKDRIRAAIASGVDPTAASATDDAAPAAPAAEQGTLDDAAEPAADTGDADTGEPAADDEDGLECPDCPDGSPKFPTEEDYTAHWYATHDENGEAAADDAAEPAAAADEPSGDDPAALIATVKARIADLSGEAARAYGKYRRDAKLPRPDEMSAEQAQGLIEFLDGLAAAS